MRRGSRSERAGRRASPQRLEKDMDNVRRLHVIEGGRQGAGSRRGDTRPPARVRRDISREVRRRRRLAAVFLALLAAGLITYLLLGPVTRTIESRRNLSKAQAELAEERSRTEILGERKNRALTDEFVEQEARKMGYVKPGEIPIIVLDEKQNEQAPVSAPTTNPSP